MSDYRININENDYEQPYEEPKRKFHYRPIPNYLRECVNKEKTNEHKHRQNKKNNL